jgi:hypothetical protein
MILRQIAPTATTEFDASGPVLHPPTLPAVAPGDRLPWTASWSPPVLEAKAGGGASQRGRGSVVGLAVTALVLIGAVLGWSFWGRRPGRVAARPNASAPLPAIAEERVVINIAYGTEKEKWLKESLAAFERTPEGRQSRINLIGLGSVEGARAVLDGPNAVLDGKPIPPIHVWSPASCAYRDVFEREWRFRHGNEPILEAEDLALTPMVFVLWKDRYTPFVKKYGAVGLQTLGAAMREPGGWGAIAGDPSWGPFKFAHTHPEKSNSGLLTLVLMAHSLAHTERGLTTADVTRPEFQEWLKGFEQGVTRRCGMLSHSTGALMREMVLRGPSQYDCLMVYENLAIDYFDDARQRWGELQVVYPEPNIWNEHPYYILNVPWSGPEHRKAAEQFLNFLLSEPIQKRALAHGFRPGNASVPVRYPESPLVRYAPQGLKIDLPRVCEPPQAEVVTELSTTFLRIAPCPGRSASAPTQASARVLRATLRQ